MTVIVEPYVAVPDFLQLKDSSLQYLDVLTYFGIKSFRNDANHSCYPSHSTIAKSIGMSRRFVVDSVKRLAQAKFLSITLTKKTHQYEFPNKINDWSMRFEGIPKKILSCEDLTANEKAILICIRQFFNHGLFTTTFSFETIAKVLGVTEAAVTKQMRSLIKKGYVLKWKNSRIKSKRYKLNPEYAFQLKNSKELLFDLID